MNDVDDEDASRGRDKGNFAYGSRERRKEFLSILSAREARTVSNVFRGGGFTCEEKSTRKSMLYVYWITQSSVVTFRGSFRPVSHAVVGNGVDIRTLLEVTTCN